MDNTNQLERLKQKAEQLKKTHHVRVQRAEQKLYLEYRTRILDKSKIDHWITQAMARGETNIWVFKEDFIEDINIANLIETQQYDHDKSIIEELRELYPSPIKCYGKTAVSDYYKQNDTVYYTECYAIKIVWAKHKKSCNIL